MGGGIFAGKGFSESISGQTGMCYNRYSSDQWQQTAQCRKTDPAQIWSILGIFLLCKSIEQTE